MALLRTKKPEAEELRKALFVASTVAFAILSTFAFHKGGGFAKFFHHAPSFATLPQPPIAPGAKRDFSAAAPSQYQPLPVDEKSELGRSPSPS